MQLTVTNLSYRHGRAGTWLFRDVEFAANPGTILAITGPSGCGKSTLLDLVGGLRKVTRGEVSFGGASPFDSRREQTSWIAQSTPVLGGRTALDNVALALLPRGHSLREARSLAEGALVSVGLEHRIDAVIGELSGGEVQRVSIARCLISPAPVILADEPTGQLDARNTSLVIEAIRNAAGCEKIVLLATHDSWLVGKCDNELRLRSAENYD
jgi:ABC-type lipoprotein export system ATPase subunit